MIATDEEALICDLAETYHVFDWRSLPLKLTATLSAGLRENSRIRMRMAGVNAPRDTYILAAIADRIGNFIWSLSDKRGEQPVSFVDLLNGTPHERDSRDIVTFNSSEEFELARAELIRRGGHD